MYQALGGDVAFRASAAVTMAAVVLLGVVSLVTDTGARPVAGS